MNDDAIDIRQLDLNLLWVFLALMDERQVTRAAFRVGLSQSALSNALGRLREACGDPLFVRSGREMVPTERAGALEGPVREALAALEGALASQGAFSAAHSQRRFRIASADYCEFVVLPRLIAEIAEDAPGIALDVTPLGGALPADDLRAGRFDLAIGYFSQIPDDCLMRDLFREDFACIARRDHPAIGQRLTLKRFTEAGHVLITPTGRPGSMVDDVLAKRGLKRRVAVTTPHFLVPPRVVAETDLISTLARRVAAHYAELYPLRVLAPPIPLPGFPINMVWHRRLDDAHDHRWLRERIEQLCAAL